jgi:hypothetical protein
MYNFYLTATADGEEKRCRNFLITQPEALYAWYAGICGFVLGTPHSLA